MRSFTSSAQTPMKLVLASVAFLVACSDGTTEPDPTPPSVASVVVTPAADTLLSVGDTVRLSPSALDGNGNAIFGKTFTWASSDSSVATVSALGLVTAVANGSTSITATTDAVTAAFDGVTGSAAVEVAQMAATVDVIPGTDTLLSVGDTVRLSPSALDANGNAISGKTFTWASSASSVATVSALGLVTAVANGSVSITATTDAVSGSAAVAVAQSAASVLVTPAVDTLVSFGETVQLGATAHDANGNAIAGATFVWRSQNQSIATVSAAGFVTAVANGLATVTAAFDGVTGSAAVEVAQMVATVDVIPAADTPLSVGDTVRLSPSALDGNGNAISGKTFTWASSDSSVATVSASGLVTAVANGSASITATTDAVSGSAAVAVAQSAASVLVTPAVDTLVSFGETVQLDATARDANGTTIAGATFVWTSQNQSIATVSAAGLVTAAANGLATVTAAFDGVTGSAAVEVIQMAATVDVIPGTDTLVAFDETLQLSTTARDANGNTIAGATFTWASSASSVATVSTSGLVTAVANGSVTLTSTSGGISGSATVEVVQLVASVDVTPASPNLDGLWETVQLTAAARDANNNPIAGKTFTWASSDESFATVSASGSVTAIANGSPTLTATTDGVSGSTSVTVALAGLGLILFSDGTNLNLMQDDGTQVRSIITGADQSGLTVDGSKVVYRRGSTNEVYTADSSGAGEVKLTTHGPPDYVPRWSWDGSRIVWIRETTWGAGNREIFVMNADGSGITNLTNDGFEDNAPAFSPDGTKIIFSSTRDGNNEIYTINSDGTNLVRLTNNAASDRIPQFSPDGSKIVFVSDRDGNDEVYVMNADGSGETRVTNDAGTDTRPTFAPYGNRVAFVSDRGGQLNVYAVNVDGTNLVQLTNNALAEVVWQWR